MKMFALIFLLISLYTHAYNQVIKGTVLDHDTNKPINFASVYFNGTFVGTSSDPKGYFELDISNNISIPLTISAMGYYSVTRTDLSTDKPLLFYLTPKVFELKEVVVKADAGKSLRKTNIMLFRKVFLGETQNAQNCEITNEKDISLIYDSDNETLKAFCAKPILLDNKALGYKISYYLDKFEYCKTNDSMVLIGNIIFREDLTNNEIQKQKSDRKRRNVYLGSRMHFFRTLWENTSDSAGFIVRNAENEKLYYNQFVTDSLVSGVLTKYLVYPVNRYLYLTYLTKTPSRSAVVLKNRFVYFDKKGYFEGLDIIWEGEMAQQRIADWLPYEFVFDPKY